MFPALYPSALVALELTRGSAEHEPTVALSDGAEHSTEAAQLDQS